MHVRHNGKIVRCYAKMIARPGPLQSCTYLVRDRMGGASEVSYLLGIGYRLAYLHPSITEDMIIDDQYRWHQGLEEFDYDSNEGAARLLRGRDPL